MKSNRVWIKRGLMGLGGILLLAVLIGGGWLATNWNKPLGPSLGLPTRTVAAPLPSPTAQRTVLAQLGDTPQPTATVTKKPTAAPAPLCGGPELMYILGVGSDTRSDNYLYGLADVIRVARVDFVTPKVTVLSLPRDLWVEIPDISEHYGVTHGKLNQAYLFGGPGMGYYDGPGGAPGLMARTLNLNFGLLVDHYGAVNMQTFVKIVDALGGIDIYLENDVDGRPIDDKTEDMGYFNAGQHHLNGSEALRLSRIRKRYNDLTRGDNQTLVLCALKKKITSPEVLPRIPDIIASFQDNVQTDLTPAQLGQLACLAPQLKPENLIFTGLPEDILEPGRVYDPYLQHRTFVYDVDFDIIRDYVDQFMAGTWPDEPDEPSCPE